MPNRLSANSTLPCAENQGNKAYCWNTIPTCGLGPATGLPSTSMRPVRSGTKPATAFIKVDLPHPDGPMTEVNEPGCKVTLVRASASCPVNDLPNITEASTIETRPFVLIAAPSG